MRIITDVIANNVDASTSFNSGNIYIENCFSYSVQVVVTGTVAGSLKLQASNDVINIQSDPDGSGVTNWTDITGSTQAISGAGNGIYNVSSSIYKWLRAVYTSSSGTGNMTITVEAKGV